MYVFILMFVWIISVPFLYNIQALLLNVKKQEAGIQCMFCAWPPGREAPLIEEHCKQATGERFSLVFLSIMVL